MLWTNVNKDTIEAGKAFIAETENNTFVVMSEFRGEVQIVFESFKLTECIGYCNMNDLNVKNNIVLNDTFEKHADEIPCGCLDKVHKFYEYRCGDRNHRKTVYYIYFNYGWMGTDFYSCLATTVNPSEISKIILNAPAVEEDEEEAV